MHRKLSVHPLPQFGLLSISSLKWPKKQQIQQSVTECQFDIQNLLADPRFMLLRNSESPTATTKRRKNQLNQYDTRYSVDNSNEFQ